MAENAINRGGRRVSPWKIAAWAAPAVILLVPLVAMQFTDEVKWTTFDFVWASVVLWGAVLAYELISRRGSTTVYRVAVGVGVLTSLVLVWINAAVGIIGDGPINVMYFGVLVVGFIGALMAQFRPLGMARALFAMAVAQMVVPVIALVIWTAGWEEPLIDSSSPNPPFDPGVARVFVLNGFFAMLFVGSGLLFLQAALGSDERRAA